MYIDSFSDNKDSLMRTLVPLQLTAPLDVLVSLGQLPLECKELDEEDYRFH